MESLSTQPGLRPPPLPAPSRRERFGWLGHLALLTAWLVALIYFGQRRIASGRHRALGSARDVCWAVGTEIGMFSAVCGLAWLCSRATVGEWRLRWRGGFGPLWRGTLYAVGLRVGTFVVGIIVFFTLVALGLLDAKTGRNFRPQIENLVSVQALAHDRTFYWCMVTLLSATAGVVEETWRAGMLAGLAGVFPGVFGGRGGQWFAIVPVAVLFGLGHLYMGWSAVVMTGLLGLVLGALVVWHRTIWDAAVAHALFDACGLALLAWMAERNPHLLGQ